jgi:hypothetical protein
VDWIDLAQDTSISVCDALQIEHNVCHLFLYMFRPVVERRQVITHLYLSNKMMILYMRLWYHSAPIERCTRCFQVVLNLPADGTANNAVSVVSCRHRRCPWNLYIFTCILHSLPPVYYKWTGAAGSGVPRLSVYTCLSVCLSMSLQLSVGPWPLFSFLNLYIMGRTP